MMKLKNSTCDETSKTEIVMKTQKLKLWYNQKHKLWQNSKPEADKTKKNLKGDKTQKLIWWQSSKTQIVTKLKKIDCDKTLKKKPKFWQNSNCDNSNCDQTQKLKLWQN